MYAVVRRYAHIKIAEAAGRVGQGLDELLRDSPGFVAYYVVDGGGGVGLSVSLFDSPEAGAAAGARAMAWIREHMGDLYEDEPQITAGPVVLQVKP